MVDEEKYYRALEAAAAAMQREPMRSTGETYWNVYIRHLATVAMRAIAPILLGGPAPEEEAVDLHFVDQRTVIR